MTGTGESRPGLERLTGLVIVAFSLAVVVAVYAGYRGAFSDEVRVTVTAPQAGLLLDTGAPVRILGVRVGAVRSIELVGDQARLTLGIDQGRAKEVPANALAELKATTVFGGKYVELQMPEQPSAQSLTSGLTLRETGRPVESNEVFQNIVTLLDTVQPQNVNAALSALAGGLSGRGEALGQSISDANTFLGGLEPSLDDAERDIALATTVLPTYQRAYPDLVDALSNFSTTGATLAQERVGIGQFLRSLQTTSGHTTALLVDASGPLGSTVTSLKAPAVTLNRYAPVMECLIQGAAKMDRVSLPAFSKYPGVVSQVSLMPPVEPYKYPEDLPKVAVDNGPNCYGLPYRQYNNPIGPLSFNDGITP